jgi:hypothetical protein
MLLNPRRAIPFLNMSSATLCLVRSVSGNPFRDCYFWACFEDLGMIVVDWGRRCLGDIRCYFVIGGKDKF